MSLIIDDRAKAAWEATKKFAQENGCHDKRNPPPEYAYNRTWMELEEYLDNYGYGPAAKAEGLENVIRIVVTSKSFDLGPHGFNLSFEKKVKTFDGIDHVETWQQWMNGGAAYDSREKGWSVHT
jgi:hypothetical protein